MNTIERLESQLKDVLHARVKEFGYPECNVDAILNAVPALLAIARAAEAAFKHNDIEDFGDNERLVALEEALATLKE